jgi:hypothetical protein
MNRRKLLVLLVILGLLAGGVAHVPVARATTTYSYTGSIGYGFVYYYTAYGQYVYLGSNVYVSAPWGGAFMQASAEWSGTMHLTYNGVNHDADLSVNCSTSPTTDTRFGIFFRCDLFSGWNDNTADTWSYSVVGTYHFTNTPTDINYYYNFTGSGTGALKANYNQAPLSVTIDGPAAVDTTDTNTWTAAGAGGTAPYTYLWGCTGIAPFWSGIKTGTTLTQVVPAGVWPLQVTVMDANGDTATAYLTVTASLIAGSYQAHLQRSGSLGQYMSVNVTDAAGNPVTISSTSGTQYGLYEAGGVIV